MTARVIPLHGGPYRVAVRDGLGEFYCYPGGDGCGQIKRDYGGYGTTWTHGDNEVGILYFEGDSRPFHALAGTSGRSWRSYKTLGGAVRHMKQMGLDSYGRHLG